MNYYKRDLGGAESVTLGPLESASSPTRGWTLPYGAIAPVAMAIDAAVIFSTCLLSSVVYHFGLVGPAYFHQLLGFAAVFAALFVTLGKSHDAYSLPELLNLRSQIQRVIVYWTLVFLFLTAVAFSMKVGESFSRGATITFAFSGLISLVGVRILWRTYLADGRAVRRFARRKVALISEHSLLDDRSLLETLTRHGLRLSHHFILPAIEQNRERHKEAVAQAVSSLRGSDAEEIVIGANLDRWSSVTSLLSELRVLPLPVNLIPVGPLSELFKLSSHTIGETVTIELRHGPRTFSQRFIKRTFDIAVATVGLITFMPLLLIAAIAIKLDSKGPVVFRQWRCGFNGRPFQIFKFRTMSVQEDGDDVVAAKPNDARVTRVGNWLRRSSIDELPQILNVLQGSMSIVGPRPHAMAHDSHFDKAVGSYAYRQHVKPGLTGWAQVHGFRGEMRTVWDIEERVKLDLWYIDNWSPAVDFKIILMTFVEILRGKNAY